MEQLDYIKDSLDIKDPNITFDKEFDKFSTHKVFYAKLDYDTPQCSSCQGTWLSMTFRSPARFLTSKWLATSSLSILKILIALNIKKERTNPVLSRV